MYHELLVVAEGVTVNLAYIQHAHIDSGQLCFTMRDSAWITVPVGKLTAKAKKIFGVPEAK